MWTRGIIFGTAVGLGGLALMPGLAAGMARGGRDLLATGLAANRAAARQGMQLAAGMALRAGAEALEQIEDLIAEVSAAQRRVAAAPGTGPARAPSAAPVTVLAGRLSGAPVAPRVPAQPVTILYARGARLRLRLVASGADGTEALALLADRIAVFPGVARAMLRPLTRSVVVEAAEDTGTADAEPARVLAARLMRAGLIEPVPMLAPSPVAAMTAAAIGRIDLMIRLRSAGRADLRSVVAMMLKAAALLRARAEAGDPAAQRMMAWFATSFGRRG